MDVDHGQIASRLLRILVASPGQQLGWDEACHQLNIDAGQFTAVVHTLLEDQPRLVELTDTAGPHSPVRLTSDGLRVVLASGHAPPADASLSLVEYLAAYFERSIQAGQSGVTRRGQRYPTVAGQLVGASADLRHLIESALPRRLAESFPAGIHVVRPGEARVARRRDRLLIIYDGTEHADLSEIQDYLKTSNVLVFCTVQLDGLRGESFPAADTKRWTVDNITGIYDALPDTAKLLLVRLILLTPEDDLNIEAAAVLLDEEDNLAAAALDELKAALAQGAGQPISHLDSRLRAFAANYAMSEVGLDAARDRLRSYRAGKRGVQPRAELASDMWTTEDKLDYQLYADAIAAFLRHRETKPPLTIGIKGPWGAGKTSLMKMVQKELDPINDNEKRTEIRLTPRSRERLWLRKSPPRERPEEAPVRNLEVLRQTRHPAKPDGDADSRLRTEPLDGSDTPDSVDWRPTVWFNAWMYQSGEQIWAGLAHEIISQVTSRLATGDQQRFWLKLNLARLDREAIRRRGYRILVERLLPMALGFVGVLLAAVIFLAIARFAPRATVALTKTAALLFSAGSVGILVGTAVQLVRFLRESANVAFGKLVSQPSVMLRHVPNEFAGLFAGAVQDPEYETRVGFLHLVHVDMRRVLELVATPSRPLVVFIDDLDRCTPSAVVQVIEAMNLFLAGEFPNCVFIMAMEPEVVAAHIEVAYSDLMARLRDGPGGISWETLGWRFLEKIIQLPLSIPVMDEKLRLSRFVASMLGPGSVAAADSDSAKGVRVDAGASMPAAVNSQVAAGLPPGDPAASESGITNIPVSEEMVERIKASIFRREPDLDSLTSAAFAAQDEVLGESDHLFEVTVIAADRAFADLYSDRTASPAIENGLAFLGANNPREIKRFTNLFRFYSFVTYRSRLKESLPISNEAIAKLSGLAIRWPDLLGVLTRVNSSGQSNLEILETAAKEALATDGAEWTAALQHIDAAESESMLKRCESLRSFLASGPPVAELAVRLV